MGKLKQLTLLFVTPLKSLFSVIILGALMQSTVSGTPLNLVQHHPGDITTHFTSVVYSLDADPAIGTLNATGWPDQFDVNSQNILGSSFELSLKVVRATGAAVGGTVTITGATDGLPNFSGTLLTGNIVDFGFNPAPANNAEGSIFEFLVQVTGGVLAPVYYTDGYAGIIMNIANGSGSPSFTGTFTAPFQNDGLNGSSDTFPVPVPEPSSLALLGLGLTAFAGHWRRKSRKTA